MSTRRVPVAVRVGREYHASVEAEHAATARREQLQARLKAQLRQVTPNVLVVSYSFKGVGLWNTGTRERPESGFSQRYDLLEPASRSAVKVGVRAVMEDLVVVSLVKPDQALHVVGEIVQYPDFELIQVTDDCIKQPEQRF